LGREQLSSEVHRLTWDHFVALQKLMPGAVVDMVANVSRISSACQLLQTDSAAQVWRCTYLQGTMQGNTLHRKHGGIAIESC
jgi:hypothetical protein